MTLLVIIASYDVVFIVICKFFKRVLLIFEKSTWFANEWIVAFLVALINYNWNVSCDIIFDQNSKFMSNFWRNIFKHLSIQFLIFITWHVQTNNQSERINQTMKIALKFWIIFNSNVNFIEKLFYIQVEINNIIFVAIDYTFNEICYDFRVKNNLSLIANMSLENWLKFRLQYKKNAKKTIAWINIIVKSYYDKKHQFINLKKKSQIYFNFHYEYIIFELKNKKLFSQRIKSFKVLQKIDALTYRLKFSSIIIIHFVIFVSQLKFVSKNRDSFHKSRFDQNYFSSITMKNENNSAFHYEIKKLMNKRISREKTQYLIKWFEYESANNW